MELRISRPGSGEEDWSCDVKSECSEPGPGAATPLCPSVKSTHPAGLLLGTDGWHGSSRQPSPVLGRGGERGGIWGGGVSDPQWGILEQLPVGRVPHHKEEAMLILPLASSLAGGSPLPCLLLRVS